MRIPFAPTEHHREKDLLIKRHVNGWDHSRDKSEIRRKKWSYDQEYTVHSNLNSDDFTTTGYIKIVQPIFEGHCKIAKKIYINELSNFYFVVEAMMLFFLFFAHHYVVKMFSPLPEILCDFLLKKITWSNLTTHYNTTYSPTRPHLISKNSGVESPLPSHYTLDVKEIMGKWQWGCRLWLANQWIEPLPI